MLNELCTKKSITSNKEAIHKIEYIVQRGIQELLMEVWSLEPLVFQAQKWGLNLVQNSSIFLHYISSKR